jgi:hypothetical protein
MQYDKTNPIYFRDRVNELSEWVDIREKEENKPWVHPMYKKATIAVPYYVNLLEEEDPYYDEYYDDFCQQPVFWKHGDVDEMSYSDEEGEIEEYQYEFDLY